MENGERTRAGTDVSLITPRCNRVLLCVVLLCTPGLFYRVVVFFDWLTRRTFGLAFTAKGFWGSVFGFCGLMAGFATPFCTLVALVLFAWIVWRQRCSLIANALALACIIVSVFATAHFLSGFVFLNRP